MWGMSGARDRPRSDSSFGKAIKLCPQAQSCQHSEVPTASNSNNQGEGQPQCFVCKLVLLVWDIDWSFSRFANSRGLRRSWLVQSVQPHVQHYFQLNLRHPRASNPLGCSCLLVGFYTWTPSRASGFATTPKLLQAVET